MVRGRTDHRNSRLDSRLIPRRSRSRRRGEEIKSVASRTFWTAFPTLNMTRKRALPPPPLVRTQHPRPPRPPPKPRVSNMAAHLSQMVAATEERQRNTRADGNSLSSPQRTARERARWTPNAVAAADRSGAHGGGGDRDGGGKGRKGNRGDTSCTEPMTADEGTTTTDGIVPGNGRGRAATEANGWPATTGATGGGDGSNDCDARVLHISDSTPVTTSARPTLQPGSRGPFPTTGWAPMPSSSEGRLVAATRAHDGQLRWATCHNHKVPPAARRLPEEATVNSGSGSNSVGDALYEIFDGGIFGMNSGGLPVLKRHPPPPPVSQSLHLAEAVKEAARAEYKRKTREDAAAAEAAAAAAATAVRKRRRTGAAGTTGTDSEPPTPPPEPPGDTEKYRRRLRMNQASAAAARHAQDVYVRQLEQLFTAQQAEKARIADDAAVVAATRARLEERLAAAQQSLRDATPATVPLPPLSRAPTQGRTTRGRWAGAPLPPSRQSVAHRHQHRGTRGELPRRSAAAATGSTPGGEGGRGRTDSHFGLGGSVLTTYGTGGGCALPTSLPPLSAAAAAVATLGNSMPSRLDGEAKGTSGSAGSGGGGSGSSGVSGSGSGSNSGFSSFQALAPLPPTTECAASVPLLSLGAPPPLPAESAVGEGGALPPAEASHLGRVLGGQAEEEMLALESLLSRSLGQGGVALV